VWGKDIPGGLATPLTNTGTSYVTKYCINYHLTFQDCYCGGKDIPGGYSPDQIPQFVLLTFDDAVNDLNQVNYSPHIHNINSFTLKEKKLLAEPVFRIRIGYMRIRILVKFEPSFPKVNKTKFFRLKFFSHSTILDQVLGLKYDCIEINNFYYFFLVFRRNILLFRG
jgi:hypothetical protein